MQDQTLITFVVNPSIFFLISQQGSTKYTVLFLYLCIINEMGFPKQPEIEVIPKHSRVEPRGQKAYVTQRQGCLSI